jgi:hypothetical protein
MRVTVDAAIVQAVEWLCHKFERMTGKTNYWILSRLSILYVICMIMGTRSTIGEPYAILVLTFFYVMYGPLTILSTTFSITGLYKVHETAAVRRVAMGLANPEKTIPRRIHGRTKGLVWDIGFIAAALLLNSMQITTVSWWLLTLFWSSSLAGYLDACDPLPPGSVTARDVFKSLRFRTLAPAKSRSRSE